MKILLHPCTLCSSCWLNTAAPVTLRTALVLQRHTHRPCTGRGSWSATRAAAHYAAAVTHRNRHSCRGTGQTGPRAAPRP